MHLLGIDKILNAFQGEKFPKAFLAKTELADPQKVLKLREFGYPSRRQ